MSLIENSDQRIRDTFDNAMQKLNEAAHATEDMDGVMKLIRARDACRGLEGVLEELVNVTMSRLEARGDIRWETT